MKSIITVTLAFCFSLSFAQNNEESRATDSIPKSNYEKVHEIRLGGFKLLAAGYFDAAYEYINTPTSGFGASLFINFDDSIENENFGISPYYRFYFGRKDDFQGERFFVELFSFFYSGEDDEVYFSQNGMQRVESGESFFDVAPGFALGSKWINSSGFVFEIKLGIGRNLLGNSPNEFVGAGDFYIGYRF
ncbi:hypothetical protein [Psychroflexus montanilacus]|uniref:hypothetical protein n=1 Tax=Psychroflexus montanilacus TaxID=2873598 RepID=UPI001CCD00E1|nr:hypothetical protein [Psychroflexus montanilacus]MBZ9652371.1 hypothetical protein [Psychroflexus montanilacus]